MKKKLTNLSSLKFIREPLLALAYGLVVFKKWSSPSSRCCLFTAFSNSN